MTLEDELDAYDARRYFGLPGRAVPEVLCRRVLSLTKTGVDYSTLTTDERAILQRWAVALGSLAPKRKTTVTVRDTAARTAARQVANLLVALNGPDDAARLARRLYSGERSPVDVLSALGFRVYEGNAVVVDAGDELAVHEYSWDVSDEYSEMADRNPDTRLLGD